MSLEAVAAFVTKALATKAVSTALTAGANQLKPKEAERLLGIVAAELNEAVGPAGLEPLLEDERTARLIAELLANPVGIDEQALAEAIEPHVGPKDEAVDAEAYASEIAASLRRNVWKAYEDDRTAIVGELRSEVATLKQEKGLWASPRFLSDEWIPRAALDRVKELAKTFPNEAASLEAELLNEPDRGAKVKSLIEQPPTWMSDPPWQLLSTLGHLAATFGLIEHAERAFEDASGRPGADRAALLARASQMAAARDDEERAHELLEQAQTHDPDHPEVVAVQAQREADPTKRLEILEGVTGETRSEVASLEIAAMRSHLELGDYQAAAEACDRALAVSPNALFARQLKASITLAANQAREFDEEPDRVELHEAAHQLLDLANELDEVGRESEAARLRTQASACYSVAGERARAARLLEDIPQHLVDADDGLRGLASRSAFEAQRSDLALAFIGAGPLDDDLRVLRVRARLELGEGASDADAIVSELDALMIESDDQGVRQEAAFLRLLAALSSDEVTWSPPAEEIVRGVDLPLATILTAGRLVRAGERGEAEQLLLAEQDDSRVLEVLVRLAAEAEDWPTALQRQRALLGRSSTPSRRLDYAALLENAGEVSEAFNILTALRSDAQAPTDIRASAAGHAADIAWQRDQYAEFDSITTAWLEHVPDSPAAAWARVGAHVRFARYGDAVALIDEKRLEPRHLRDAREAAQAFYRALPTPEAVRRIAEVSDRFERSDAWLEMLVIRSGLGAAEADLTEELHERRGKALAEFEERFPDSGMLTSEQVPETPEGIHDWLRTQFDPDSAKALADLQRTIMEGKAGVAHLAAFVRKPVAETWTRLFVLPLGFGNPVDRAVEREDALATIGKPAVWDTASLFIVGGLGGEVEAAIRNALLGSVVSVAVLDDAASAADTPRAGEQGERLEVGWDSVANEPRKTVITAEEVEREERTVSGVLALAHGLLVTDNVDPERPSRFDEVVSSEADAINRAVATITATLAIADRRGLAVYSDDRFVRAVARGAGIPTFGTPALIDALAERGLLTAADRDQALACLRLSGAHGLPATPDEIIEAGRAADWKLTPELISMVVDRGFWFDPRLSTGTVLKVLRTVFDEAPDEFVSWVARFVDGASLAAPGEGRLPSAVLLLASAWLHEDRDFINRLTRAVGSLWQAYGFSDVRGDYISWAARLFIRATRHLPEEVRVQILGTVLAKLDGDAYFVFERMLRSSLQA